MEFNLHPALQSKIFICDLPLCRVLMENSREFPWLFLVPRKNNVRNMCDLTGTERLDLMREIELCEQIMMRLFRPTQTNVAMIGNLTPQLHVHLICRYETDSCWPGTVWGQPIEPYDEDEKQKQIELIRKEIACQK